MLIQHRLGMLHCKQIVQCIHTCIHVTCVAVGCQLSAHAYVHNLLDKIK